jgi:hypothetical protein
MGQAISWFGGTRFTGFSDDEIRAIQEGATIRARQASVAMRQGTLRASTARNKRNLKRKAA